MALLPLSRFRSQTLTSSMTDCLFLSYFFPLHSSEVGRELHTPRGRCVILMGCKCIFCLILDHCALPVLQGC